MNHDFQETSPYPFSSTTSVSPSTPVPSSNYYPVGEGMLCQCLDFEQIERDVARCTWHLVEDAQQILFQQEKYDRDQLELLLKQQRRLANLINLTLLRSTDVSSSQPLRYYQGYHDVASIVLSAFAISNNSSEEDEDDPSLDVSTTSEASNNSVASLEDQAQKAGLLLPSRVLGRLSSWQFHHVLQKDFSTLQSTLQRVFYPLMIHLDPQVHDFLTECAMEPFFCISWIITWFAHDVTDTELVKRLYDALLVSHPLFSVYLSMAMVLHPYNRRLLLKTECEFAQCHQCLASLPKNSYWPPQSSSTNNSNDGTTKSMVMIPTDDAPPVPFQELLDTAYRYMQRYPPRNLSNLADLYWQSKADLFFQSLSPPPWTMSSNSIADWVVLQRVHKLQDLLQGTTVTQLHPKLLKKLFQEQEQAASIVLREGAPEFQRHPHPVAVIAAGYGPGINILRNRQRRRRKLMVRGAVVCLVGVSIMYYGITAYRQKQAANKLSIVADDSRLFDDGEVASLTRDKKEANRDGNAISAASQKVTAAIKESFERVEAKAKNAVKVDLAVSDKTSKPQPVGKAPKVPKSTSNVPVPRPSLPKSAQKPTPLPPALTKTMKEPVPNKSRSSFDRRASPFPKRTPVTTVPSSTTKENINYPNALKYSNLGLEKEEADIVDSLEIFQKSAAAFTVQKIQFIQKLLQDVILPKLLLIKALAVAKLGPFFQKNLRSRFIEWKFKAQQQYRKAVGAFQDQFAKSGKKLA